MSVAQISCLAFLGFSALLLSSCDTIAPGYVNRLPYSVTIAEHPGPKTHPFTLPPGQFEDPGFGRVPRTFDVFRADGRLIAQYRPRDLAVSGDEFYHYIVIDERGAHVETRREMLR